MSKLSEDSRIDPRIKQMFGSMPEGPALGDVDDRDQLLAEANTVEAIQQRKAFEGLSEAMDNDQVAPIEGLTMTRMAVPKGPQGQMLNINFIRPDTDEVLPCVYYIHGGGMQSMSCFLGMYRGWGKIIAGQGVAVAMVDFRNCLTPSSVEEVAAFPAGLEDCIFGLDWVIGQTEELSIDPSNIIVAGESGGGNLTLALGLSLLRGGKIGDIRGLYALCPYIAGSWPQDRFPSSIENNGILLDLHSNRGAMAYGIDELINENPLAWPGLASIEDLRGLPDVVVSVNECDPLRDEGIAFYRMLLEAGVAAQCRQVMGTIHATEIMLACPEISRETARSIADFARGTTRNDRP